jgi:hypothetical protein
MSSIEQPPSKDQLSEQQIRNLLADAQFGIKGGRALDSLLVSAWALEQLCEAALAQRAADEPPAAPLGAIDLLRTVIKEGGGSDEWPEIAEFLARTSQPPSPVHSGMVDYMQRYFFEIHGLKYSRPDVRVVLETCLKQPDPSLTREGNAP